MKNLLILVFILFLSGLANASTKTEAIEKFLPLKLENVKSANVLKFKRDLEYLYSCALYPHVCVDGVREYSATIRMKLTTNEEVDFDCYVEHHFRASKRKIVIPYCTDVAGKMKLSKLYRGKKALEIPDQI